MGYALREDGSYELREDGGRALREADIVAGSARLREDGRAMLREAGGAQLREAAEQPSVSAGGGGGADFRVIGPSRLLPRKPWEIRGPIDAVAMGADLAVEVELLPGEMKVIEIELVAGAAQGQVAFDRTLIDADLLAIAGSF